MAIKINSISTTNFMRLIMNRKPICTSDTSKFYNLDKEPGYSNGILKIYSFEKLPRQFMQIYLNLWPREILEASKKDFVELITILELIVVDNMFRGHISKKESSSFINFDDCIKKEDIKNITERFKRLNEVLEKGIARDIAFPDLMTRGNLKINPRTNEFKIFDLEGLQANKLFAFAASDLLGIEQNENFSNLYLKFTSTGPYLDLRINRAILIIYYIKSLTGICLPLAAPKNLKNEISTEMIIRALGLVDDDLLAPFIRDTMNTGDIKPVPNGLLDEFSKKYTLKSTRYANTQGNMFQKR